MGKTTWMLWLEYNRYNVEITEIRAKVVDMIVLSYKREDETSLDVKKRLWMAYRNARHLWDHAPANRIAVMREMDGKDVGIAELEEALGLDLEEPLEEDAEGEMGT